MKALISSVESVMYTSSYVEETSAEGDVDYSPVQSTLPNSYRISQVYEEEFEVAPELFWIECNSSINALLYYYNTVSSTIEEIPNVPAPE